MTILPAKTKAIILDFDGTIADSSEIFIESLEAVLGREQRLSNQEIEELRKLSTKEIIRKLGIKKWQLPRILARGKTEVTRRIDRVKLFAGMPEVLTKLSKNQQLYILSSNSEANITKVLDRHDLSGYVTKIYGDIGLLGKAQGLKKLLKRENLKRTECVYVGDETRDLKASRKVKIDCVLVGWGYGDPDTLKSYNPSAFASKPQDLLKLRPGRLREGV